MLIGAPVKEYSFIKLKTGYFGNFDMSEKKTT